MQNNDSVRTKVRDVILATCSPGLDDHAVLGVEWAARKDTVLAIERKDIALAGPRERLEDVDTFIDSGVAL